jgi:hypothetical protein
MDVLGMIVIFILGAIAFNFGNDNRSIAATSFGILLEIIALSYIFYKILNR